MFIAMFRAMVHANPNPNGPLHGPLLNASVINVNYVHDLTLVNEVCECLSLYLLRWFIGYRL